MTAQSRSIRGELIINVQEQYYGKISDAGCLMKLKFENRLLLGTFLLRFHPFEGVRTGKEAELSHHPTPTIF